MAIRYSSFSLFSYLFGYYATCYFMIGHYLACYFFLGTMYPIICYWELCIPLSIIGYSVTVCFIIYWALCSLLTHYCTKLPVILIIVCTTFHLWI